MKFRINVVPIVVTVLMFGANIVMGILEKNPENIGIFEYDTELKAIKSYHNGYIALVDYASRNPKTSEPNDVYYSNIINEESFKSSFIFSLVTERYSSGKHVSFTYHLYDESFAPLVKVDNQPDNYDGVKFSSNDFTWINDEITINLDYMSLSGISYVSLYVCAKWVPPGSFFERKSTSESILRTVFHFIK